MSNPLTVAADRRAQRLSVRAGGGAMGGFAGAMSNRLTADWILAGIQSADQEVQGSLTVLKQRSRELARNNPHASRYLQLKADNVLGDEGIMLQAMVKTPDGEVLESVNRKIEDAWSEWCEECTVDGKWSFRDVERTVLAEEAGAGDSFVRMVPAWRENRFGFALQLIDPDQVDVNYNEFRDGSRGASANEIRMGVEVNEWGRPVGYHVWPNHPSEPYGRDTDRVVVPASQMVHWYRPYRVGQTRGIPDFAPILMTLKMLARYEEAELVAARIASAKGGFFERPDNDVDPMQFTSATPPGGGAATQRFSMEVEPGLFESLPAGWKFSAWDPVHPTNAFPSFHKAMLRTVSTGLGVSYSQLSQDWESTSFSSSRMDERTSRPMYRVVQRSITGQFHRTIVREWLLWAITTGALDLPLRNLETYRRSITWQPRGWEGVDREKDARADALEVRMGVNSRTRIAANHGRHLPDVLDELAREEKLAREKGVVLSTDTGRSGASERVEPDGRLRDDEDEDSADALIEFLDYQGLSTVGRRHLRQYLEQVSPAHTNGNGRGHRPPDRRGTD